MTRDADNSSMTPASPASDVMARVKDKAAVYDRDGKHVGKVDGLFMGAEADAAQAGVIPQTPAGTEDAGSRGLIADMTDVFGAAGNLPDVVRNRMRQQGFIRIDPGLLGGHRYALREHIASAEGDRVTLNITRDGLIKP